MELLPKTGQSRLLANFGLIPGLSDRILPHGMARNFPDLGTPGAMNQLEVTETRGGLFKQGWQNAGLPANCG